MTAFDGLSKLFQILQSVADDSCFLGFRRGCLDELGANLLLVRENLLELVLRKEELTPTFSLHNLDIGQAFWC